MKRPKPIKILNMVVGGPFAVMAREDPNLFAVHRLSYIAQHGNHWQVEAEKRCLGELFERTGDDINNYHHVAVTLNDDGGYSPVEGVKPVPLLDGIFDGAHRMQTVKRVVNRARTDIQRKPGLPKPELSPA